MMAERKGVQQIQGSLLVLLFCHHSGVRYTVLVCFHLCFVSVLFTGPFLPEMRFSEPFSLVYNFEVYVIKITW